MARGCSIMPFTARKYFQFFHAFIQYSILRLRSALCRSCRVQIFGRHGPYVLCIAREAVYHGDTEPCNDPKRC